MGSESCVRLRLPSFPRTTSARKPKKHLTGGASGAGSALLPVAVEEEQGLVPAVWDAHSAGPSDWEGGGGAGAGAEGHLTSVSSKSPAGSHGH